MHQLERDFEAELNRPRRVQLTGRADQPETGARRAKPRVIELNLVERVDCFAPHLRLDALGDPHRLDQRRVNAPDAISAKIGKYGRQSANVVTELNSLVGALFRRIVRTVRLNGRVVEIESAQIENRRIDFVLVIVRHQRVRIACKVKIAGRHRAARLDHINAGQLPAAKESAYQAVPAIAPFASLA